MTKDQALEKINKKFKNRKLLSFEDYDDNTWLFSVECCPLIFSDTGLFVMDKVDGEIKMCHSKF